MKTTCSVLTDTGCKYDYENRPSGGKNLIPSDKGFCTPNQNPIEKMKEWESYQKQLSKIVKIFTGKTVDDKLKEDVENLFYDIKNNNIEGVSKIELEDIKRLIPLLVRCYPEIAHKVVNDNVLRIK